jgi:hypothetical protein
MSKVLFGGTSRRVACIKRIRIVIRRRERLDGLNHNTQFNEMDSNDEILQMHFAPLENLHSKLV